VQVEFKSLRDFLSEKRFELPIYQRSYDWKPDVEVKDLISDITSCLETDDVGLAQHFIGTVLLDPKSDADDGRYIFDIVDGQQRVTSFSILLIALRNVLRDDVKDREKVEVLQSLIGSGRKGFSSDRDPYLVPAVTIKPVYEQMSAALWRRPFDTTIERAGEVIRVKREVNRVKPVFDAFYDFIKGVYNEKGAEGLNELYNQLLQNTKIIEIRLTETSQASEIFERTNDRGRQLSIADLLKNHLHARSNDAPGLNIETTWEAVSARAGSGMKQMLKFFMVSREGSVSSRELYRRLKNYAAELGLQNFVDELLEFSKFYEAYRKGERDFTQWLREYGIVLNAEHDRSIQRSHVALARFGIGQPTPAVFSVANALRDFDDDVASSTLKKLFKLLESYHFVNNKIANRVGNDVEKLYQRFSEAVWNEPKNVLSELENLRSQLELKLASYREFEATLASYRLEKASSDLKKYILVSASLYEEYNDGHVNVFDAKTDIESVPLAIMRIGRPTATTETLQSDLPYLIVVKPSFKSYSDKGKAPALTQVRDELEGERRHGEGLIYSQFRQRLDIEPTTDARADKRFKGIAELAYENIAEDIIGIAF